MPQSMTGFGAAQADVEGISYTVEIRSVNSRYFKFLPRMPDIWSGAETEIEGLVRQAVQRGSVTLTVRMRLPDDRAAYRINTAALGQYLQQLKLVEMDGAPTLRIDLGSLLQLPGVCEPPPMEEICQSTHDGLMQLIRRALDAMMAMRGQEGRALKDILLQQCDIVEANIAVVRARAPDVVKDYHARLAGRVQELMDAGRAKIDADALAREVAIFAERSDIEEEVARLETHLQQFRKALEIDGPCGRKLDFVAQEMLREANTIAAKANDTEIAAGVLEIKTAVDRLKEQTANVE